MKNITKALIAFLGILVISCNTNDVQDRPVIQGIDSPVLTAPLSSTAYTLLPANATSQIERFVWTSANYNGAVAINYQVQMDVLGGNFSTPKILGGANNANQVSVSVETLNGAATDLGALPFVNTSFDIRVVSSASGFDKMASNKITIVVNPYTTALPTLAIPGNHQAWTPATAPVLAASAYGKTDFEGFVWLNGDYKFVLPNATGVFAWGNPDFGDDGSFAGMLVETGESNCNAATAGYYFVKANTGAVTGANPNGLKYSADPTDWGVIGAFNGWGTSVPMTYSSTTKKWTVTLALTAGDFKFRANNGWSINLGGDNTGDGSMDFGGPNITVATAGTYTVTLDLSNPRLYTYSVL